MPILWDAIRQGVGDTVDRVSTPFKKVGLPDFGISEAIAGGPTVNTDRRLAPQGYASKAPNSSQAPGGIYDQSGNQIGSSSTYQRVNTQTSTPKPDNGGGNGGGGGVDNARYNELKAIADKGDLNPAQRTEYEQMMATINQGQNDQQGAAERAAEARRQAAMGKYNAMAKIAEGAKGMAKESYDWLIDTIGSNKQDLLSRVATQETQGLADYQMQEDKTTKDYDKAKQEILSTYRDLQTQQEKIMRGGGMSSSSRSQEAQLRLSNLLGKDLSTVRTNEADSLAMIGNAVTKFKDNIRQTNISIETEATQKLDKAALDYKQQIQNIDNNLTLSAAEREEAYAQAESQLAADSQAITQWATGLKVQAQQFQAEQTAKLDNFVADMLDENGMLNSGLDEKRSKTNEMLTAMGYTPMETNPTVEQPGVGVYQKANMTYKDKDALDAALQAGEITTADYQQQLRQIQSAGPNMSVASASPITAGVTPRGMSANRDPLFSAMTA